MMVKTKSSLVLWLVLWFLAAGGLFSGFFFGFFASSTAWAVEPAYLIPLPSPEEHITGLEWASRELESKEHSREAGQRKISVTLKGKYDKAEWTLLWEKKKILRQQNGEFHVGFAVPVTQSSVFLIEFLAIGPLGEVEREQVGIFIPDFEIPKTKDQPPPEERKPLERRSSFIPSLGYSLISYRQTGSPDFSETALTAKAAYNYVLSSPRWALGANGYYTVLPLGTSRADVAARYLGLNLRVGYLLSGLSDTWQLTLMAGTYYTTMSVSQNAFGYQNIGGPQLFPVVRWNFRGRDTLMAYFKYSPVSDGLSFLTLDNRELAVGGGWSHPLRGGNVLFVGVDLADLVFNTALAVSNSTSLTFSAGYGW